MARACVRSSPRCFAPRLRAASARLRAGLAGAGLAACLAVAPGLASSAPTALDQALLESVRKGDGERAIDALSNGADVDVRDAEQWTPLMHAALRGHTGLVLILLSSGADPDARDANGSTALMAAAVNGHLSVARALVDGGARLELQNRSGETARQKAESYRKASVASYLRAQEALRTPLGELPPRVPGRAGRSTPAGSPSAASGGRLPAEPGILVSPEPTLPLEPEGPLLEVEPTGAAESLRAPGAPSPRPFEPEDEPPIVETSSAYPVRIALVKGANVRAAPSPESRRITALPEGRLVEVLGQVRGRNWYLIAHPEGDAFVYGTVLGDARPRHAPGEVTTARVLGDEPAAADRAAPQAQLAEERSGGAAQDPSRDATASSADGSPEGSREAEPRPSGGTEPPRTLPEDDSGLVVVPLTGEFVVTQGANLRSAPDPDAPKLGSIPSGTRIWITGRVHGLNWYRVGFGSRTAYVFGSTVERLSEGAPPEDAATPDDAADGPPEREAVLAPPSRGRPARAPAPRSEFMDAAASAEAGGGPLSSETPAGEGVEAHAITAAEPRLREDPAPLDTALLAGRWRRAAHPSCVESHLDVREQQGRLTLVVHLAGEAIELVRDARPRETRLNRVTLGSEGDRRDLRIEGEVLLYSFQGSEPVPYVRCPETFSP